MNERTYQRQLIEKLETRLPGCWVLHNDPKMIQGIPDLLILHGHRWAMLEVKVDENAHIQPNQQYYIGVFDALGFAAIIYPENEKEVLDALQRSFRRT